MDRAERIAREFRKSHLLTVSLAAKTGKEGDLREACDIAENAIAAALRSYAEPEWQPIETAPKDGTAVLLYAPNHGRWIAGYNNNTTWRLVAFGDTPVEQEPPKHPPPTHWLSLPSPPTGDGR